MKINQSYTTKRTVTEAISLRVPTFKVKTFNEEHGYGNWEANKPIHPPFLLNASDEEIILTYNSELSGLANYYALHAVSDSLQK